MSNDLERLVQQALDLPPDDRARLAQRLIVSLDEVGDPESERRWVEEAERRFRGYKEGRAPSRSAEDVFRDAGARNT